MGTAQPVAMTHAPSPPSPALLLDASHTSHTRARTGVQRVVRSLFDALGKNAVGVTFDPFLSSWRMLEPWETANLHAVVPAGKRGADWPLSAKVRGRLKRLRGTTAGLTALGDPSGTILPEIFSPAVAANLASLPRPRVAVFHDAIALKLPEYTPKKTVARFPTYLRELLMMDGIAAVSDDSRDALLEYWRWLGIKGVLPVRTIPLGIDVAAGVSAGPTERQAGTPATTVLCVGSVEGRKNHLALLDACEQLWSRGLRFELRLIGMPRPETAAPALARIRDLQALGRLLRHDGAVPDAVLEQAYRECAFTVYPSLMEGFGLPVFESLAHGKPCVCSGRGALGEAARGGGCLTVERVNAESLAGAIERLLTDTAERARLAAQAQQRRFRTWDEYARELGAFVAELA